MLKKLRLKFVCINMTLVTVMLAVILGMVLYYTGQSMENQSIQMMQSVARTSFEPGRPDGPGEPVRLPYFTVQVSPGGELIATGSGYYDLSDEELIRKIVQTALDSREQMGLLEEYSLRFSKSPSPRGESIVFVDISSEQATMDNLAKSCVFIGVISFAVFLVISLLLARWAVKPVDQAWEQQRQFVADASHELKTPLTVIMTNAELLQSPEYDEASRQQFSSSILTMSRQMRSLVEGLLELARVDNGAVKTAFSQWSMSDLVSDAVLPFEPLYFERGLTLDCQAEPGIWVRASQSHLRQVLEILLDNAMKYSVPGIVTVRLQKQGNHCQLTVANPGEAISPEDLKNIFKRFYRVDKARSRDGSYGLGLSIAERIVREHGGRIWAQSAGGVNSFHVQLPIL